MPYHLATPQRHKPRNSFCRLSCHERGYCDLARWACQTYNAQSSITSFTRASSWFRTTRFGNHISPQALNPS